MEEFYLALDLRSPKRKRKINYNKTISTEFSRGLNNIQAFGRGTCVRSAAAWRVFLFHDDVEKPVESGPFGFLQR